MPVLSRDRADEDLSVDHDDPDDGLGFLLPGTGPNPHLAGVVEQPELLIGQCHGFNLPDA